ncbi:MAG: hypothetical protein ACKPFA_12485, partial [Dolichospermum sp.]
GKSIEVQAGQKLGNVIHDALSSGPHLDFGVRLDGKYIEPQKFLQDFMSGKYGGVVNPGKPTGVPATGQRQIVPAMSVPQPTQTTKQEQQEYKNEQDPWQRFTNWLIPKAGAAEMPQQKTNTGVNFRKTSDVYKLNIDPKKTRLEFSKGWDQESKAYKDNNALGYFTAPMFMFNSRTGIERGKVVPVADLKFQDSVFRTTNRSAAKQRAFVSIDKQGKTRFGYGELTPDLEKQSDVFIGGLHSLYNNTEKQPAGYKGAYNRAGKQAAVLKTLRIRLIYGLNKDGTLSIVQSRKNLSIDEAKKLALKNGFIAAYLPDHGSKSRVIVPGVQAFDPTMRREVGGYDSPTPYLIKVTAKPTDKPEVTAKPAKNTFISEPEPEKSGWDNFTNNTKKLLLNLGSQLPKFKLPEFKLPKFKLPNLDPRIDTKFLQDVSKIAQSVGANPEDLLKVMLYETGGTLSPSIRNPRTKATGLIQFMPATAKGLGTNIDALSQMTPQKQLFFVQKYLKQNSRGQKLDSFRKVLSTVFAGNPNASLGVGDGDITLGNYLKKAEARYGAKAREMIANSKALDNIVMQGGFIQPNQMQQGVTQATQLKLDIAGQQY